MKPATTYLHGNEMISRESNVIQLIQAEKGKELLKRIQHYYTQFIFIMDKQKDMGYENKGKYVCGISE